MSSISSSDENWINLLDQLKKVCLLETVRTVLFLLSYFSLVLGLLGMLCCRLSFWNFAHSIARCSTVILARQMLHFSGSSFAITWTWAKFIWHVLSPVSIDWCSLSKNLLITLFICETILASQCISICNSKYHCIKTIFWKNPFTSFCRFFLLHPMVADSLVLSSCSTRGHFIVCPASH